MKVKLKWKPNTWLKKTTDGFRNGALNELKACALEIRNEAVRSMKTGGKRKSKRRVRDSRGRLRTRMVQVPSAPGTPPHKQTSNLRNQIKLSWLNSDTIVTGPTPQAWYGKVHEFGGRRHPKRSFMRPAMKKVLARSRGRFRNIKVRRIRPT